ncbi:hypothetical protein IMG5_136480 [Ichthyophthirius multifiliis]|uniref:Protein kinase domain protein n=1 Tax=Ichthyophthirius multifiliis TaxID=5932 RepID=G0QWY6_ICHMU|nr:hypothetical protein IMG5_136480 [Ichthyophthirius multifiliis]EGR30267.1 hypothetical protein IMG5_136480 [Ichthyophthirius multifiliis]|eukprot:XP_004065513.1 hypothetical protein IMG5_136480 [Ichthyophthirius multifiliis]
MIDKKETKIYIIMEYCEGGDLSTLLKKCKKKTIIQVKMLYGKFLLKFFLDCLNVIIVKKIKFYIEIQSLRIFFQILKIIQNLVILVQVEFQAKIQNLQKLTSVHLIICLLSKYRNLSIMKKAIFGVLAVFYMKWLLQNLLFRRKTICLWLQRQKMDNLSVYQQNIVKICNNQYKICSIQILK